MSRFLSRNEDGIYSEEIESMEECKWKINEVCCNDSSKHLADYCYHTETRRECFVEEDGIIEEENK